LNSRKGCKESPYYYLLQFG